MKESGRGCKTLAGRWVPDEGVQICFYQRFAGEKKKRIGGFVSIKTFTSGI